ncbi:MAG: CopD family protein [Zoogloeaceae bacterium]|nr:CopD family protein [Zoogloeaceae bacterium]
MRLHYLMLFLHIFGVVVWVGGMLFAHVCLRPSLDILAPSDRLTLMRAVLGRFFSLVWAAMTVTLVSGAWMFAEVGVRHAPGAWHVMALTGLVMASVFVSIWFGPWPALTLAVSAQDWAAGAGALARIRQRVGFNLVLGLATIALGTLGLGL